MKIISLFSGCWWLDLWFKLAGFEIPWANEYDKTIRPTLQHNFPDTIVDSRDIRKVPSDEIPDGIWIIWWPPCQSWSEAWSWRWIQDTRWQLFYEYIRIIKDKQPLFFLAENVSWILAGKHNEAFSDILNQFKGLWYEVSMKLLNANDYWVPEDRQRVIIVWYHHSLWKKFVFPESTNKWLTLKDAIWDLQDSALPARIGNRPNWSDLKVSNHEYFIGEYSSIYMSRNRVRAWNEPSFTIQAGARHAPIHPQAPKMKFIEQNKRIFEPWKEHLYRRLSVRECARVQTFPDNFNFLYERVGDWYKMIWNAVPVNFANAIAKQIYKDIKDFFNGPKISNLINISSEFVKTNRVESLVTN